MDQDTISAFRMQLKPGNEAEYKKRHDEIWPELAELLKNAGIKEYYIFLDPVTLALFAFQKKGSNDQTAGLSSLPIMKKWWDYMADLMEVNDDNSPKTVSCPEVFRL
ncbi:L-rhamnose mutarotase [Dyadobacter fanqingshengii]|uniref:L-rhamnose mutarotase n=1 Tax=Dyadobacter fanqingshengii TaxID=2906443 RepID=A0A9X1TAF1_9BACT|nr:L-rhamnose mutarotase [Dyadobacter fanqingshengii]MCF0042485.1 L-rhamnose mutarotase [Dyadobacter fanqingshengii]MCF2506674.1 L-rhamnose mutarotase [Dyadobacter fanqingshengii]USJ34992.1 L-rhamnose mutarotase [Dyadobacter fanqingshengii]